MTKERPKIYSLEDIENVVSSPEFRAKLIDGIRDGFVAFEKGEFFAAPIQTLGLSPFPFLEVDGYAAQTCVKSGYFRGHDHYVIKVASGGHPMPSKYPAAIKYAVLQFYNFALIIATAIIRKFLSHSRQWPYASLFAKER